MEELKSSKQKFKHGDFLGIALNEGDFVSFSESSKLSLSLGVVVGFTKATIKIKIIQVQGVATSKMWSIIQSVNQVNQVIFRSPGQVAKLPDIVQDFSELPESYVEQFFNIAN